MKRKRMEELAVFHLVYFLFTFFVVYPPNEVLSAGFSIPSLFSSVLGSEQMHFVHYHITRISLTIFVHSLLPLGYYVSLALYAPELGLFNWSQLGLIAKLFLNASILLVVGVFTLVYFYWPASDYSNHPVVRKLKKFSNDQVAVSWKPIASQINTEFRRIDKFSTGTLFNRIHVTDSWLIKVNLYSLSFAMHQTVDLILTHANEVALNAEGAPSVQFLNILVKPNSEENKKKLAPFYFGVNSLEYRDLTDKLQTPVKAACSIIIKQSLPDQFLDPFRELVQQNPQYDFKRENIEPCIGCMKNLANVKLVKNCDELQSGECRPCACRPMWCLECLGKWFAYRQDQSRPETWLASKASCATCRATFCVLDVALVNSID